MQRDAYHDYITDEEMEAYGRPLFDQRFNDLYHRSGASTVNNAVIIGERNICNRAFEMRVVFGSTAWTGKTPPEEHV